MKIIGSFIYLVVNLFLLMFYSLEIRKYYASAYNYDGFRYFLPIAIADIFFVISLFFLFFSIGQKNNFYYLLTLFIMHNINMGLGVDNIPFLGFIIGITSIYFILKIHLTDHSDVPPK